MTISNISGATNFSQSGVGLDAEGQLALLVLENQDNRHAAASADKALARERFVTASNEEVAAMREEAKDVLIGACAQAAVSLGSCAIQLGDALSEPGCDEPPEKPWGEIGAAACNASAQAVGKALGDNPAANDRAEAKRAGTVATQATWQLDDARDVSEKSAHQQDKALDWLAAETANRASTENAIIAGLA